VCVSPNSEGSPSITKPKHPHPQEEQRKDPKPEEIQNPQKASSGKNEQRPRPPRRVAGVVMQRVVMAHPDKTGLAMSLSCDGSWVMPRRRRIKYKQ
jgi:hypothetical protein